MLVQQEIGTVRLSEAAQRSRFGYQGKEYFTDKIFLFTLFSKWSKKSEELAFTDYLGLLPFKGSVLGLVSR